MKQILIFSFIFLGLMYSEIDKIEITPQSKVLLYSNYFWPPCEEARALLKSNEINYSEKKISFSKKGTAELAKVSNGNIGTPQLVIDGKYFGGLKELKLYFEK